MFTSIELDIIEVAYQCVSWSGQDQPRLRKENKKAEGKQQEQIRCRIIAS